MPSTRPECSAKECTVECDLRRPEMKELSEKKGDNLTCGCQRLVVVKRWKARKSSTAGEIRLV